MTRKCLVRYNNGKSMMVDFGSDAWELATEAGFTVEDLEKAELVFGETRISLEGLTQSDWLTFIGIFALATKDTFNATKIAQFVFPGVSVETAKLLVNDAIRDSNRGEYR